MSLKAITTLAAAVIASSAWAAGAAETKCGAGTCGKKEASSPKDASCSKQGAAGEMNSADHKEAACSKKDGMDGKDAACSKKDTAGEQK